MGEQLGTGKTPETFPEELPPLQEENSEIANLNNDTQCWNQEGRRRKWSISRARGKRQCGACEKKSRRNLLVELQRISCLQEIQGSMENKLPLENHLKTCQTQQPPAQTPRKPPRHSWAVTNLRDIKIKEWCIKRCGNCNLSFSTVNLWILMTGSHLHLTISVLEHFLGTGGIFLSQ